jgi:cytidine deaminase
METAPLTAAEEALLDHTIDVNAETFDPEFLDGAHIVAASVRTMDGEVFDGVSLPASIGRASMCAEPVAIGSAIADGYSHDDIEACVAVAYPMPEHDAEEPRVVPPCGVCREMLADYNPEMRVIVPEDDENRTVRAGDLLPIRPW